MGLHRIRLAAPWELSHRKANSADTAPAPSNCKLPLVLSDLVSNESASDSESEIIFLSRRFHCPTGIDSVTRVFIEIAFDSISSAALLTAVVLNKVALSISSNTDPSDCSLQVDASGRLLAFNVLQLQFPVALGHTSGRLLSVTLMIEE